MTDKPRSYYDILNVSPQASDEDIKFAYRRLAKRFHPDQNPRNRRLAELRFRMISEAYAGLKTVERRRLYDMMRGKDVRKKEAGNDNRTRRNWFSVILGGSYANENSESHG